jgi:polyphosphate kinase 2 (PPK2 family)
MESPDPYMTDVQRDMHGPRPKMKNKEYLEKLRKLQIELCRLQDWVRATKARVIVVFEVRDAAGKGGIIKAITERVSPRCSELWPYPRRASAKRPSFPCSAISRSSPRAVKS